MPAWVALGEGFLHGAKLLGLPPAEVVGVEDSDAGMAALGSAGMIAVRVGPKGFPPLMSRAGCPSVWAVTRRGGLRSVGRSGVDSRRVGDDSTCALH